MNETASTTLNTTPNPHVAELEARYGWLQDELAAASNHMVGTVWWNDRIRELQSINRRLGR